MSTEKLIVVYTVSNVIWRYIPWSFHFVFIRCFAGPAFVARPGDTMKEMEEAEVQPTFHKGK